MVHRVISAIAVLALASAPVVARTRLFCRYTGLEITDCAEQGIPVGAEFQVESCCNRQVTQPLSAVRVAVQQELTSPALIALPAPRSFDALERPVLTKRTFAAVVPTGPPVFLVTRSLLL